MKYNSLLQLSTKQILCEVVPWQKLVCVAAIFAISRNMLEKLKNQNTLFIICKVSTS